MQRLMCGSSVRYLMGRTVEKAAAANYCVTGCQGVCAPTLLSDLPKFGLLGGVKWRPMP